MEEFAEILKPLKSCRICPRQCKVDRFAGPTGYCRTGTEFPVSSICLHRGEEPVLSGTLGMCNLFFYHCNLQCVFCQNYQISRNTDNPDNRPMVLPDILDQIEQTLDRGHNLLGFVSPSHCVPQMRIIVESLHKRNRHPVIVYNTNGYDRVKTLREIEDLVDVYLPDFKYSDAGLAKKYSEAPDYPRVALAALKEMARQKGTGLALDRNGLARAGILIRHLVLPGAVENSLQVLRTLTDTLGTGIFLSLMSQYHPVGEVYDHPLLGRRLYSAEYSRVTQLVEELGIENGWVQGLESPDHFLPDFNRNSPFEG